MRLLAVSSESLEVASTLLPPETKLAGDVKISLVTAYEAIRKNEDAVALCEILKKYPCLAVAAKILWSKSRIKVSGLSNIH